MESGMSGVQQVTMFIDVTEVRAVLKDLDEWLKDPSVVVYKRVIDSVALIVVPGKDQPRTPLGTLIDAKNRYVLTSDSELGGADEVRVQFPVRAKDGSVVTDKTKYLDRAKAGEAIAGKVVGRDKTRDLALVQLERLPDTARPVRLAGTGPVVAERIWQIGSPAGVTRAFAI